MSISIASNEDIPQLAFLINSAYAGETSNNNNTNSRLIHERKSENEEKGRGGGWTSASGVIDGPRINVNNPSELYNTHSVNMLKYVDCGEILGCVRIEKVDTDKCYFSILSVSPKAQANGIGSRLLEACEDWAIEHDCSIIEMTVINVRESLINYYKRRGYKETGSRVRFPLEEGCAVPKVPLELIVFRKTLQL